MRRVWTRACGRTSSCICGRVGFENKLLLCGGKFANVTGSVNNFGMKEDKKPGCKGELEFSWIELLRLMI